MVLVHRLCYWVFILYVTDVKDSRVYLTNTKDQVISWQNYKRYWEPRREALPSPLNATWISISESKSEDDVEKGEREMVE